MPLGRREPTLDDVQILVLDWPFHAIISAMKLFLSVCIALMAVAGCSKSVDLAGKSCPCVSGYVCDTKTNTCVPDLDAATDDATVPDADSGGPDVPGDAGANRKRVFVTSATYNGNLGGIAGANAKCEQAAADANLEGEWIAWISTAADLVVDRIVDVGPWYLVDQVTLVADNKAQLTALSGDPELNHAINMTESGNTLLSGPVWTGTKAAGTAGNNTGCSAWSSSSGLPTVGLTGELDKADRFWTENLNSGCDFQLHLYCFEQ